MRLSTLTGSVPPSWDPPLTSGKVKFSAQCDRGSTTVSTSCAGAAAVARVGLCQSRGSSLHPQSQAQYEDGRFEAVAGHTAAERRDQTSHGKEVNLRLVWIFSLLVDHCTSSPLGESCQR